MNRTNITFDIGCGSDPDRWRPGTYKFDLNVCDVDRALINTLDDLEEVRTPKELYIFPEFNKDEHIIGFDFRTQTLPTEDETVDAIYMRHAFSYMWDTVDELVERLRECTRVLRVGGVLLIQDYCHAYDGEDYVDVDYQEIRAKLTEALEQVSNWTIPLPLEPHFEEPCRCGDEYVWIFERSA